MLTICISNECPGLDHALAQRWVAAWQRQVTLDLAPIWNVSSLLHYIGDSKTEKPGPVDGLIKLVQFSSVDGALGAHWWEGGRPVGEVGVQTAIDNHVEPTEVGCHEVDELTVDPLGVECVQQGRVVLMKETSDRVSHTTPDYKINGFVMENFSRPSAFIDGAWPFDFRKTLAKNVVADTGYQLQIDLGTTEWQMLTGARAAQFKKIAAPGSRAAARMMRAGADPSRLKIINV